MERIEIYNKLISILEKDVDVEINNITEETGLLGENYLDSLDFINYITKVEQAFSISISDEELDKQQLGYVKNMIDFIKDSKK